MVSKFHDIMTSELFLRRSHHRQDASLRVFQCCPTSCINMSPAAMNLLHRYCMSCGRVHGSPCSHPDCDCMPKPGGADSRLLTILIALLLPGSHLVLTRSADHSFRSVHRSMQGIFNAESVPRAPTANRTSQGPEPTRLQLAVARATWIDVRI